jgi:membrane protease YdiL (CAAX protease family)
VLRLPHGCSALLEVLVMFIPAIPAYLWLWPNVHGTAQWIAQVITYLYIFVGTLFIGLRRWGLNDLGLNRCGITISLVSGTILLIGRQMVILSVDWNASRPQYNLVALFGLILYYIGMVGLVEELLFRGLIYRALEEWLGVRWAIWGSSFGFLLWHIFGQGAVIGLAAFAIGMIFALIRWRAGGILGLIIIHGLWDLQTVLQLSISNAQILAIGRPDIPYPLLAIIGLGLMVFVPIFLWKLYPLLISWRFGRTV